MYNQLFEPKGGARSAREIELMKEYREGAHKFSYWRSILGLFAGCLLLMAAPAHAQQCDASIAISSTTVGYTPIVVPGDPSRSIHICGIHASITQGATPANYRVIACSDGACGTVDSMAGSGSVTLPGHASYLDYFNVGNDTGVAQSVRKGYGLYLYLSSAPTNAVVVLLYGRY